MAHVEVYARPMCGFCFKAKKLLAKKSVDFVEYDIWEEAGRKDEMVERSGGATTVPQIFIDGRPIGGCDELMTLEARGELDKLLETAA
ncbi:MAG: glutaredoxin 3 [Alphaproteobacteria bacterium]|nr:glutaredoxin 3 [Alphaproteobacteria bacterium]